MKTRNGKMRISVLALAVQGALVAMPAMSAHAEDDVSVLTKPTNSIEIGVESTPKDSAKFGEYNGLNQSGADLIGNFSVRGGDAYNAYDGGSGINRWEVTGTNLGTTSRELGGTVSNQGQWNLGFKYDELRRNLADGYQTPYQGSMGGNNFTLPAGFGTVANTNSLNGNAVQQTSMHTVDIDTTRKNTSFNAGYNFDRQWSVKLDYNHLAQSGAKLRVFGADGSGGVGAGGEAGSMLPDPTNYRTDTIDLALNWIGDKGHVTASYFRSTFRDGYDRVTWTTYNTANATDTMTTPPSNEFNQLNLTGGYAFSDKTKLAGGLSYGRNTQNEAFVPPDIMLTPAPVSSLNGLVVTSHADLKLTNQSVKDWVLSAGVKYDKRDNRTASNFYNFNAIDNGNPANYPNAPLSNKKTQLELAGDYRLDKTQHIRLAYNRENINRWCDQYAAGSSVGLATYPAGSNCVVATASKDDKISATYKLKAREDVNLNVGYGYSDRKTDSDMAAITEFKGNTSLLGPGVNGGDFQGFHPFFDGSRKEQMLKAGVDWQATDKLTLGLSGKYTDDKYGTDLGVTKGSTWSLNLDSSYIYRDKGSITAYLTQEHRERDMTDQQNIAAVLATGTKLSVPANSTWSNKLKDDDTTLGLGVKQGGLMGGKLDLAGDLTYSIGKTGYGTQLNYAGANNTGLTCSNPAFLSCGDVPDIKNTMIQFKLVGNYKLDKSAKVALGYLHQSLKSDDYYYNALQYGTTPTKEMPTNQQSGSYSVNLISAAYIYEFK